VPISPAPAVLRACELLAHLSRHPAEAFSVSDLARALEIPRATCDAILLALAEHRFVARRDGDLRYELGAGGIALGDAARSGNAWLRAASAEAEPLARANALGAAVCIRDADIARVAAVFDHGPPFGLRAHVGQSIPLIPPFAAVFVAWNEDESERWIGRSDPSVSEAERERYRRALAMVRRRGCSVSLATQRSPALSKALDTLAQDPDSPSARSERDEIMRELAHSEYLPAELEPGAARRVVQLAAPVFDASGRVAASLMLMGPDFDITEPELDAVASRLVQAAARATQGAGGRVPVV
jgi:DNA-binding IclR family transcriptional regulator